MYVTLIRTWFKFQVAQLEAQVVDLTEENQQLRSMLSQITNDYNSLHKQWITVLQEQKNEHTPGLEEKEVIGRIPVVPMRFMDLGLAGAYDEHNGEDNSVTFSNERSRSRSGSSPNNNSEMIINSMDQDCKKELRKRSSHQLRDVSPDQEQSPRNGSSKVQRLSPTKSVDEATETTMRKARVSVRARSQEPMVTQPSITLTKIRQH